MPIVSLDWDRAEMAGYLTTIGAGRAPYKRCVGQELMPARRIGYCISGSDSCSGVGRQALWRNCNSLDSLPLDESLWDVRMLAQNDTR